MLGAALQRKAVQCHLSVNLYQLVQTQYQVQVGCPFRAWVANVTLSSDSSRKNALIWFQVRAHNNLKLELFWGRKVLGLSWIYLSTSGVLHLSLTMHHFSGSNLHCKLKSLKFLLDLSLDKLGFLVIDEATNILQFTLNTYGLGYRKGFLLWPEKFTE